ncbi:PREDICTED: HIG1 domain family member 1A, mitochondrial-like [Odobenus rosmarus divergens]|uniref:HIG1 domain family member 1A, mitochondrial-like n=1 Tax=Odobenus rosmarus divergens TaxID=9708 RepID=A0A9B0LPT0_ODORO
MEKTTQYPEILNFQLSMVGLLPVWRWTSEHKEDLNRSAKERLLITLPNPSFRKDQSNVSHSSYDEEQGSKLLQKAREAPFVPVGKMGFAAIIANGLYKSKNRGNTKMSVHLVQMCVTAQGFAMETMTLGMGYSLDTEFWAKPEP